MLRDAPKAETQSSGDIKIQPSPVLSSRYTLTFRNITTQKTFYSFATSYLVVGIDLLHWDCRED